MNLMPFFLRKFFVPKNIPGFKNNSKDFAMWLIRIELSLMIEEEITKAMIILEILNLEKKLGIKKTDISKLEKMNLLQLYYLRNRYKKNIKNLNKGKKE